MERADIIARTCAAITQGELEDASAIVRSQYPFQPSTTIGRSISRQLAMRVFTRDGFVDRYSGKRLIFPGALRALSVLLPSEVPHHANWRMDACHIAYYELFAVVDHLNPVARGGSNEMPNLITTSTLRNSAKANFTCEELGWRVLDEAELDKWDGLVGWFLDIAKVHREILQVPDVLGWHEAACRV